MTAYAADRRLREATVLLPRYLCLTIAVAGFALSANALTAVAADSQAVTPEMAWLVVVVWWTGCCWPRPRSAEPGRWTASVRGRRSSRWP